MQIRNEPGAWVDEEFETLDLGDPRRDRRAKELLKRF
ncbi:transposase DNA-binding-containing protein, partial [Paraburkholderia sp. 31.1]